MHQVRYFLSMSRLLNFTRAADACNVTQPSLTRAIQKLEDELGGALFRRERSRTHLTDLGRLMLPHLERTFEAAQAAKRLASDIGKADVAPLLLGVDATVDCDALDELLAEIARSFPGLKLTLVTDTTAQLLARAMDGDLDLVIVEQPDDPPERLESWRLFTHDYVMLARRDHPLAEARQPRLDQAGDELWIDHDGGDCPRLRALAPSRGFDPVVRHSATDVAQVKRLIAAGLGSAFMPCGRPDERLAAIRFADAAASGDVVLAAVSGRKRSIVGDAFVRAARARSWSRTDAA